MKKKFVLGLTSLVVASAVAIGGTLAYMTAHTVEKDNSFQAVGKLTGQIQEITWDGIDFGGIQVTPATDPTLGQNIAKAMTPGMNIPKDPKLKNTSDSTVYMAMKVTYDADAAKAFNKDGKQTVTLAEFTKDVGWTKVDSVTAQDGVVTEYYVFGTATDLTKVNAGTATSNLFSSVAINKDATSDQIGGKSFDLKIRGSAVQSDLDCPTAISQMEAALNS
ncbi:MAG TPA: SipW-dependent-type signal peptide-containing protein [Oscillospiraceae bacterium]|nr:SipW-dependent-type signal peptide-containing protein [Oscillospiraceae bacterium]